MAGVGVDGGYAPPIAIGPPAVTYDYPPGPSKWQAGATWPLRSSGQVYALDLNQQLSQAVAFLSRKPMFQGVQSARQPIQPSSSTPVNLDTEIADPWQMHNNGSPSLVTVPYACDGVWLVTGSIPYDVYTAGSYYVAEIAYNTSTIITGEMVQSPGTTRVEPAIADLISASAGDTFQLYARQTSASAVDTRVLMRADYLNYYTPTLTARWVASGASLPGGVLNGIQLGLPNPHTWNYDQEATSATFNSDIRDSVLFLANVPACRGMATGTPAALTSGTAGQVTGLTANIDNWNTWNATTNTWTCPLSGLYLVYGQVGIPTQGSALSAQAQLHCTLSGVTTDYRGAAAYGSSVVAVVMKPVRFTAGDTFQLYGWQNGGSLAPNTVTNTRFFTLWLSA